MAMSLEHQEFKSGWLARQVGLFPFRAYSAFGVYLRWILSSINERAIKDGWDFVLV